MHGLLSGLTVLEVANEFGEWTGRLLADLGARVIKIEPPGGNSTRQIGPFFADRQDGEFSLHFWHYNAGKESVTLDLEEEGGQVRFRQLAEKADILIETLRPGQLSEWGLSYEALAARNPGLIVSSIAPFGERGPRRDWAANDLTLLAMGGPMASCGYDDVEAAPMFPAGGQSYHTAGHYSTIGILLALIQRLATGRGQHIHVPIQACLAVTTERGSLDWIHTGKLVRRQTGRNAMATPTLPSQLLCGDGRYANIAPPREERLWRRLVNWLTEEGIAEDLGDEMYLVREIWEAMGVHINEVLMELCARHTAMEIFHLGQAIGMPTGAVRRPEEWLEDPHTTAREFFVPIEHPAVGQTLRYPGPPYRFSDAEVTIRRYAPRLGEQSERVFAELGIAAENVARLQADGTI